MIYRDIRNHRSQAAPFSFHADVVSSRLHSHCYSRPTVSAYEIHSTLRKKTKQQIPQKTSQKSRILQHNKNIILLIFLEAYFWIFSCS